ncbi:iron-dependent repressor [Natrinema saccharevitans]|uniref:Iron-dependent repressor n=1 Tax=Natrinema saccharevitans TaxID=301967 RepID=A0A1S8AY58_9EURY|nr:metal-dependent transcriptional regulator [Natrinema saccharevitans]OLZ41788.1 iron-dependent repressor [Natrinema saccharevitans]
MTDASQYLLACYHIARKEGEPVSPGSVADELERSPSVTTETLQRLEKRGYVRYQPYEGATLTERGRETAADLHERYVVLATFFREVLDLAEPDREAMALAGSVSSLVTDRVAETLLEAEGVEATDVSV